MRKDQKERLKHLLPSRPGSKHMDSAHEARQPMFNPVGRVEDVNPEEVLIADVRRHPIGLFFIYILAFLGLGVSAFLLTSFVFNSEATGSNRSEAGLIATVAGLFLVILALVFLFLATKIYTANQLIITGDNVTQVSQIGLFHRRVSELSMENIEDVTAHQEGVLGTIFNYGRIHIETAGEQDNYNFKYCPNPNAYAKAIQDARLVFVKKKHS